MCVSAQLVIDRAKTWQDFYFSNGKISSCLFQFGECGKLLSLLVPFFSCSECTRVGMKRENTQKIQHILRVNEFLDRNHFNVFSPSLRLLLSRSNIEAAALRGIK
jgi:hypothetical protein